MSAQLAPVTGPWAEPRVVGSYRLERLIGSGGMGDVWLGRHVETGGLAAVKLLKRVAPEDEARAEALFTDERRAIARLSHPHIVGWHEIGPEHLAMRYVRGTDLGSELRGHLSPRRAVRLAVQIASALAHAHDRGVAHRDVKPANILLDEQGNAHLADFGVALLAESSRTHGGAAFCAGTPSYMAPEQAAGGRGGPLSDQYSLARTLLAVLAGRRPAPDAATALAELPRGLPGPLVSAMARALSTDPADRFPSMCAFGEALEDVLSGSLAGGEPMPARRDESPFAWARGAVASTRTTPQIRRSDFLLSSLEASGLLPAVACEAFRTRTGYADLGFTLHGREDVLGPLDAPRALARAGRVVLLAHGLNCTREVWSGVAATLCRDHADALVLAPDLHGFGASRFREPLDPALATPRAAMEALVALLELLGAATLPVLVVGHSFGGTAVLARGDDELPPTLHRVAITPVFPSHDAVMRGTLRLVAFLLRAFGGSPRVMRTFAEKFVSSEEMAAYSDGERAFALRCMTESSPAVQAALAEGLCRARPADARQLARCTILVVRNDPVAREKVLVRALRDLGISLDGVRRLAGGTHAPQYELAEHPEWTARNVSDIAECISELLAHMGSDGPSASPSGTHPAHSKDDATVPLVSRVR